VTVAFSMVYFIIEKRGCQYKIPTFQGSFMVKIGHEKRGRTAKTPNRPTRATIGKTAPWGGFPEVCFLI
jgi:hypothetical protein